MNANFVQVVETGKEWQIRWFVLAQFAWTEETSLMKHVCLASPRHPSGRGTTKGGTPRQTSTAVNTVNSIYNDLSTKNTAS